MRGWLTVVSQAATVMDLKTYFAIEARGNGKLPSSSSVNPIMNVLIIFTVQNSATHLIMSISATL